ncbi:Chromatin-remodeling complexes subunit NGG1 [Wickerhamiella sorbophila]|uniref:Chromatin-remodeling complexes subunit NGG1 n=1 Tax=Wickerhamiella sorbophila TaxID=45607 RepID=A0A2T0FM96_9ASCO|nr:Chromatin-remodeling complexes subunit NGG1 [Wickerhamiella sorbophila]PRT56113.1 Chromatin-remodeling complexes subunit NGG1 [Wickerhamiella sorbophila]
MTQNEVPSLQSLVAFYPDTFCLVMAKRRREEVADILGQLVGLVDGPPEESVLAKAQQYLEKLVVSTKENVQHLDAQLTKLTKTTNTVVHERQRRQQQDLPAGAKDVEMEDAPPADDPAGESGNSAAEDRPVSRVSDDADNLDENAQSASTNGSSKFVQNPKSEFVASQVLPISALGLFDDTAGDDDLKAKYGVASYPAQDLSPFLPGPIPDEDYTRAKPPNQVQGTTFAAFLEPYFRLFNEEDLAFLQQRTVGTEVVSFGRTISPYVIPPLGPLYTDVWAEEDRHHHQHPSYNVTPAPRAVDPDQYIAHGSAHDISDMNVETGRVVVGPLTARLMSAILPEDGGEEESTPMPPSITQITPESIDALSAESAAAAKQVLASFSGLEERLMREFRYVGILDMNILRQDVKNRHQFKLAIDSSNDMGVDSDDLELDWNNGAEDDEVCREMRELQAKLRVVTAKNQKYKRRLLPHVQEQMAWQEYTSILDDLDKQVDQVYLKRLRVPKSKKKKTSYAPAEASPAPSTTAVAKVVDQKPATRAALDKRTRWMTKIGSVFRPHYLMWRSHMESKFDGDDEDEDDEEEEEA